MERSSGSFVVTAWRGEWQESPDFNWLEALPSIDRILSTSSAAEQDKAVRPRSYLDVRRSRPSWDDWPALPSLSPQKSATNLAPLETAFTFATLPPSKPTLLQRFASLTNLRR